MYFVLYHNSCNLKRSFFIFLSSDFFFKGQWSFNNSYVNQIRTKLALTNEWT